MTRSRLHALTWLAWAIAAVVSLQLAPNVLYAALVLLVSVLVVEVHRIDGALARTFPFFLAFGAVMALVRVALTVLTTHGTGRELVALPMATLPRVLGGFTIGGSIELEVLLRAVSESAVILATIAVFGAWNAVVSHHEVLQAMPRAFHEPGLVVTVAVASVPATLTSLQQTREADRARTGGTPARRRRLRAIVPVLERGLERAVALSESMDSRGFGRGRAGPAERASAWCGLAGLVALGGAFVALVGQATSAAAVLGVVGAALAVVAVVVASRASHRTRYRPRPLARVDGAVMALVALAPVGLAVLTATGDTSLVWDPGTLRPPGFDPVAAALLLLLVVPALVRPAPASGPVASRSPLRAEVVGR